MGCGKSSVGRELSKLLCCPFMDLDAVIEETEGRSIPEIFATDGEAAFRAMEVETLRDIISHCGQGRLPKQSLPSQAMGPSLCGQRGSTVSVTSPDHSHTAECQFRTNALSPDLEWQNTDHILQTDTPHDQTDAERISAVLALGGGAVMTPECAEMVREHTLCVYLRASVDTLVSHLEGESSGRPILQGNLRQRIEDLMARRSSTYENTAHVIIDTDGKSIETIASEIISLLRGKNHTL